jgi:hypothetical protein
MAFVIRRTIFPRTLSFLGFAALCYLVGAAVMFFELPSSEFLSQGFVGARAWSERKQPFSPSLDAESLPILGDNIDKSDKTFDGFTLYTCASQTVSGTQAFLINMRCEVVHRWAVPFSRLWPQPPHIQGRVNDSLICFFACRLYPNGDLLVVFHGIERLATGFGLAKLDKDSNVLWKYSANIHHDVDVGEDGTIYALRHDLVREMPKGLRYLPTPSLVDSLVVLSPDGKELRPPISLLEALRDSPYSPLLSPIERTDKKGTRRGFFLKRFDEEARREDVLHANCVQVLSRRLAPKFPLFKAGQVLVSMRHLDALAVMEPQSGALVWAARGPWRAQHDPQFLDNGHLLIFDNLGSPKSSRVLEYDPLTQAFPWQYPGDKGVPFFTSERGMSQRLPNGNTLIVDSEGFKILEVSQENEVVWTCTLDRFVCSGRRFSADQLPFLSGQQRPRPH